MAALSRLCVAIALLAAAWPVWADEAISSIKIEGLKRTQPRVVTRELPFEVGGTWHDSDAEEGERRLRNLGLFSEVKITPPDATGEVLITVKERWTLWLLPEGSRSDGGASTAGAAYTDYNLWGLNHQLRVATRIATGKNFSKYSGSSQQASYLWRRVADTKFSLDASINKGQSVYDVFELGTLASSYAQDTHDWAVGVGYGFGPVPGEGLDLHLGFQSSDTNYTLKSGKFQIDVIDRRRNSINFLASFSHVDDKTTWFTGSRLDYSLSFSETSLGSTYNAVRQTLSLRNYTPIGGQKTINTRLNAGWVAGNTLRDGLFDVGNRNNIRGYYAGDVQGSAYVYGTVEARIPFEYGSNVQWVAFADVGHVNRNGKRALDKAVIAGLGGGIRWTLRWLYHGTLNVDVAYGTALHRWRVHLGTGQDF